MPDLHAVDGVGALQVHSPPRSDVVVPGLDAVHVEAQSVAGSLPAPDVFGPAEDVAHVSVHRCARLGVHVGCVAVAP